MQKFYPTARRANSHHAALWRLKLGPAETEPLERFATTMPPICRAIADDETSPLERIDSFLSATVDALIRRAAANDPFFTRVHAQAAAPDAAGELRLVSALLAESSTIPGEPGDNNTLVDQVQLWTSKLTGAPPATGWQLTFELIEPPDEDPTEQSQPGTPAPGQSENTEDDTRPWQVTFEPHSLDDGKSIDAGQIWTDASPLSALGRLQGELRAVLAAELKRAVEFFPPLEKVQSLAAPTEIELSSAEAQQFMRQWALQLKSRNFGIELPAWAEGLDRRLSLVMALRPFDEGDPNARERRQQTSFNSAAGPRMGLDSVLSFDWRISVGGVDLSPDEFETLVRRQSPLVKLAGRWVEIDADAAANAEAFLRDTPPAKPPSARRSAPPSPPAAATQPPPPSSSPAHRGSKTCSNSSPPCAPGCHPTRKLPRHPSPLSSPRPAMARVPRHARHRRLPRRRHGVGQDDSAHLAVASRKKHSARSEQE